jgi:hypothetical protein
MQLTVVVHVMPLYTMILPEVLPFKMDSGSFSKVLIAISWDLP